MTWEFAVAENAWKLEDGLYRILVPMPWAVPFVNVYLVESQGQYMLIDAGMNWGPSLRAIGRALKAIGVPAGGLTYLFLTHRHPDHSGGSGPVQQRWGGRVLAEEREIARPFPDQATMEAWFEQHGVEDAALRQAMSHTGDEATELPPKMLERLDLSQPLKLGSLSFELIAVPGHSYGQVILREPTRGWLFLADHVLAPVAPNVWCDPGDNRDLFGEYLESLERTMGLEARLYLPGHGMPFRDGMREASEALANYHHQYAQKILSLVQNERQSTWEITSALSPAISATPADARFEIAEVLAALVYLERRGLVSQAQKGRWHLV